MKESGDVFKDILSAIESGDVSRTKSLLPRWSDVDGDRHGLLFLKSITLGHSDIFALLMESTEKLNLAHNLDYFYVSLFHHTIANKQNDILLQLLPKLSGIQYRGDLLVSVASEGNLDAVRLMLPYEKPEDMFQTLYNNKITVERLSAISVKDSGKNELIFEEIYQAIPKNFLRSTLDEELSERMALVTIQGSVSCTSHMGPIHIKALEAIRARLVVDEQKKDLLDGIADISKKMSKTKSKKI